MTNKKKRIIHSPEFKAEALKLAEQAEELDIVKKATYFAKNLK